VDIESNPNDESIIDGEVTETLQSPGRIVTDTEKLEDEEKTNRNHRFLESGCCSPWIETILGGRTII
jgi:hypothetical protein